MSGAPVDPVPEGSPGTIRAMVDMFADRHDPRPVAIRARLAQRWSGTSKAGVPITAVPAPSALAVREALRAHRPGAWTVILTDRDADDLGAGILAHLHKNKVHPIDPWGAVQEVFRATQCAGSFVSMPKGREVAFGLIRTMPLPGWPPAPGGVLTREHALDSLIHDRLGIAPDHRDAPGLLEWSFRSDAASSLAGLLKDAGDALGAAVLDRLAEAIGAARHVVRPLLDSEFVADLAPLGLVVGLLTADGLPSGDRQQAAISLARAERWWQGRVTSGDPALRAFGDAAVRVVTTWLGDDRMRERAWGVADRADAFLAEVDGLGLARHSAVLPTGYRLRADDLGRALAEVPAGGSAGRPAGGAGLAAVEEAWAAVVQHRLAERQTTEHAALAAAVRLARWLGTPDRWAVEGAASTTLAALARAQTDDAAWADAAINAAAVGVSADAPARGIEHIVTAAMARREDQARRFAAVLARATSEDAGAVDGRIGEPADGVVLIERVLDHVVAPLVAEDRRVLLVVLDGLSTGAGTEVATDALRHGWEEIGRGGRRVASIAVLPTLTQVSRASLFAGELTGGGRDAEALSFTRYVDQRLKRAGDLFHKKALDTGRSGHALAADIAEAVDGTRLAVVGVVLNTIDDALDRSDPGGTTWSADAIKHLQPLLARAQATARTVVITGDHGHIVERRLGHLKSVRGQSDSGRSRSAVGVVDIDPAEEVLVEGRRVVPDGRAVLAVSDRLRYGPLKAGYHGGAHPAEVVVPVIVLQPVGWSTDADQAGLPPQEPAWWLGPVSAPADDVPAAPPAATRASRRREVPRDEPALFEVGMAPSRGTAALPAPVGPTSIGRRLVAGEVYATQVRLSPRLRVTPESVARLVDALLATPDRRLGQVPAAQALGVPTSRLPRAQEQVKQLLNVDGYAVLRVDADGVTLALDERAMREQFGVSRG